MLQLQLSEIKGGWAARAGGWAVHGATQEEATQRFYAAEEVRRSIKEKATALEGLEARNNELEGDEEAAS